MGDDAPGAREEEDQQGHEENWQQVVGLAIGSGAGHWQPLISDSLGISVLNGIGGIRIDGAEKT